MTDAVLHSEVEILEPEPIPPERNEMQPPPTQFTNVVEDQDRVVKDIYGEGKTLINYLDRIPKLKTAILELRENHPELLLKDEKRMKMDHRDLITLVTQRIRISLWQEFESAVSNNRVMRVRQIWAGICTEESFYKLVSNPPRLAFILIAPTDYVVTLKEAHEAGLEKIREIFSAKIIDEEGNLNVKAADVVIKAFALMDARLKGAVVQRVDQRVLTANLTPSKIAPVPDDMDNIELELQKARAALAKHHAAGMLNPVHPTPLELQEEHSKLELDIVNMNGGLRDNSKVLK